jgi:hypothetical protein
MSYQRSKVTIEVEQVTSATCDNCGGDLEPAGGDWRLGPRGGLEVNFVGGYGGYIDGSARMVWCRECLERMEAAFPSIKVALDRGAWDG